MPTRYLFWDLDSVMTPGRATTHLARGYDGDYQQFMRYFLETTGTPGPLEAVPREQLEHGFRSWQDVYGPITSIGDLAECLTDLRHKVPRSDNQRNVFPSSRETIFTKNYILRGLSIGRAKEITDGIPYNPHVEDAVQGLRDAGVVQILFSNTNAIVADRQAERQRFAYARGALPVVCVSGEEVPYDTRLHYSHDDAFLAGRMHEEDLVKTGVVMEYIENQGIDPTTVLAIDDSDVQTLTALRERGAVVLRFYSEGDKDCTPKNRDRLHQEDVEIITDVMEIFRHLRV